MTQRFDCRNAFSETLVELARQDSRIVAVVNDSVSSTKLGTFSKEFDERFVNVGIAEQNMVGVGSGLANGGKLPFVCGASCFLTARAMEQLKVDVGYSKRNVKICGMSSGMAYGELGPTHHSIEDLAWTRVIGNMTVVVPADPIETSSALREIAAFDGPVFFRLSRMPVPVIHSADYQFRIGKSVCLRQGTDITLIATGVMVHRALEAAELLAEQNVSARVINMSTIRPLDTQAILAAASETKGIVTAEEHSVIGGLGGAVAEVLAEQRPTRMKILGVPGVFAPTGSAEWLLEHFGLTNQGIQRAALQLLQSVAL
jgi:transketolase